MAGAGDEEAAHRSLRQVPSRRPAAEGRGRVPGERDNWVYLGRLYRSAFKALQRLPLREYPVRRDFPPRVGKDKSFGASWPEREAIRRVEAEQKFMLTMEQVKDKYEFGPGKFGPPSFTGKRETNPNPRESGFL